MLERTDQPMSEDLPLMREVRSTVSKCLENGTDPDAYPDYAAYAKTTDMPRLYSGCYGLGSRDLQPEALVAAIENMTEKGAHRKFFYLSIDFIRDQAANPKQEIHQQEILAAYPKIKDMALRGSENPNLMPKGAIAVRMHSVGGCSSCSAGTSRRIRNTVPRRRASPPPTTCPPRRNPSASTVNTPRWTWCCPPTRRCSCTPTRWPA